MDEHTPIAKTEARFLEHELDLVSLNTRRTAGGDAGDTNTNNNNILYFIIGVMSAALLLPLLAYWFWIFNLMIDGLTTYLSKLSN